MAMNFHAHQLVEALRSGDVGGMEHGSVNADTLAGLLESAQCFYAGDVDLYGRRSIVDLTSPFARLLFPATYVEFELSDEESQGVLCILAVEDRNEGCVWLTVFHKVIGIGFLKDSIGVRLAGRETALFSASKTLEIDSKLQEVGWHYAQLFVAFLEAMACRNVETVVNEPSVKLNKKRVASGKVPLFVFRTLHIKAGSVGERSMESGAVGRIGPRLHFRRGHIRRLPDKLVWVQPCMVGSLQNGMVIKDYEVTP